MTGVQDGAARADDDGPTRCGFVALIGEPNAGKSTLLNRMVGAKVSIVTHKVQTTRFRVRGVTLEGRSQIVFVDTPGLFQPRRRLDRAMVAAAWSGAADADVIALLVEAHRGLTEGVARILSALEERASEGEGETSPDAATADARPDAPPPSRRLTNTALVINKIDRVRRDALLALVAQLTEGRAFDQVFLISAENGDGVADLRRWLAEQLPTGPWLYPEDDISDLSLRLLAAEITREKLTLRLHQELPYQLTVETESWTDQKDGSARIEQIVYVGRDGHKGIVLGRKGETIREIGRLARLDIAALIERPAHLFLRVAVRPDWEADPERYAAMGLDFDPGDAGSGGR